MIVDEHYILYKIAYELMTRHHYNILYIKEDKEIWLEKFEHKTSRIIRLQQGGFDWKNHLKKDVAVVFQKVKSFKKMLHKKNIQIHNVYISSHEPIDDWDFLKQPMQLKQKQSVKMFMYYISNMETSSELSRFQSNIGVEHFSADSSTEADPEHQVHLYKQTLESHQKQKQNEKQNIFSQGKPFWTYILLVVNVLMFLILTLAGGSEDIDTLIRYGAKYNVGIIDNGEWWRIISSMFLHIGLLHLVMNMLAVYFLGVVVERIYGSWRFIVIYFLAGIGGGMTSFAFSSTISAGASGALFGLFGALLYFGTIYRKIFFQTMGQNVLIILLINLVFGFTSSQIDMAAHIGGLLAGFLASALLALPNKKRVGIQMASGVVYVGLLVALTVYGLYANEYDPSYHLQKIDQFNQEEKYHNTIDQATQALDHPEDQGAMLHFQRAYAYIMQNQTKDAIMDLEKAVELDDEFAKAYTNLGLAYYQIGEQAKASAAIEQAYDLDPDADDIGRVYEEITGHQPNS